MKKENIILGRKFKRLTIIKEVDSHISPSGQVRRKVECLCECGNKRIVSYTRLKRGEARSCGCDSSVVRSLGRTTHGMTGTRFFNIYYTIKHRCTNGNSEVYKNYGGRGIELLWKTFEHFKEDMFADYISHIKEYGGKHTTIDRIDNNGNYCKENCKWSTYKEQARNRRSSRRITFNGITKLLCEWQEELNIDRSVLERRIDKYGWSIERAFTTDVEKRNYKTN